MRARRVLFVCSGNICRSPMAEGLLRQAAEVRDLGFEGVVYFFQESLLRFTAPGETVDSRIDGIRGMFPTHGGEGLRFTPRAAPRPPGPAPSRAFPAEAGRG
jgi:hypothetical protein